MLLDLLSYIILFALRIWMQNQKKIPLNSTTLGQNILHKVHPKIICHLPPCLIGSGLSWGIQCLFKLVWKTLNCVCWSRHKNHLYLLALQRYAAVLEFLIRENYNNGINQFIVKLRGCLFVSRVAWVPVHALVFPLCLANMFVFAEIPSTPLQWFRNADNKTNAWDPV